MLKFKKLFYNLDNLWKYLLCYSPITLFLLLLPFWNNALARSQDLQEQKNPAPFLSSSHGSMSRQIVRTHPHSDSVALTFDDGPHPKYTPQILAILKHYHIKATFFIIGESAQKYPELIRAINAQGHVIANHSMTHPYLTRLYGKNLYTEIVEPNLIIYSIIGKTPLCVRPPYGLSNHRIHQYIESKNMHVLLWNWSSFDYKRQSKEHLVRWVLMHTHPGDVLLMHDGNGRSYQTVQALPEIIEGLRKKGLKFDVICNFSYLEDQKSK